MSNQRKQNEILEEQRRVHAELLELKKIKSGEITIENTHKLEDAMPKTFWGKVKNNLYHYKTLIIIGVIVVALVSFGIYDAVTKTKPDIEIVAYTYNRLLDEQLAVIGEIVNPYCDDINEDDTVKINTVNCTFDKDGGNMQMQYTSSTSFHTMISGNPQAIFFILDRESYQYLVDVNEGETFIEGEPLMLNSAVYEKVQKESGYALPEGLMLCYRKIKGTLFEDEEMSQKGYKTAKKALKKMAEEYQPEEFLFEEQ